MGVEDIRRSEADHEPQFGGYDLLRKLGSGGMSEVFLVRPAAKERAGERYALKRLLPELAEIPDFVRLFDRETRLAARLCHPNLVRVVDWGVEAGRCFLVSEYVEGLDGWKTTRRLARRGEQLPTGQALRIVLETLEGLGHLHRLTDDQGRPMGVVHRDVSPSNIFLSRRGEVKLGDVGIALLPNEEAETRRRKRLRGKIRFLSPEQIAGRPLDARSDLFAVGVLLAEFCLGRSPFEGQTDLAVLLNIRDVRLHLSDDFERNVPAGLRTTLLRTLAREPGDRPADAEALRAELAAFAEAEKLDRSAGPLAATVERLLQPGDVGDEPVFRSTLTPLVNAPIQRRDTIPPDRTPALASVAYRLRRPDGVEEGPFPFAKLLDGVVAGTVGTLYQVSADDGPFVPLSAVPGLRQHLPVLDQTTTGVKLPAYPDRRGRLEMDTVPGLLLSLLNARETGLLVVDARNLRKEVYLAEGNPLYVSSNLRDEQLGEYLVAAGVLTRAQLDLAAAAMPRHGGLLHDTLVAMEMVDPMSLFEHLADHVRARLLELFTWKDGAWSFYRQVTCDREFLLLPATPDLLRQGIDRSLAHGEESTWWTSTAPLDLIPLGRPSPPADWWHLDATDRLVLDAVRRRIGAAELLGSALAQAPHLARDRVIRSIHFCLTAGLVGIAYV